MAETQGLEITNFSGGITDKYLDGDIKQSQILDNLLIDINGKIVQRPGYQFRLFDEYGLQIMSHGTTFGHTGMTSRINSIAEITSYNRLIYAQHTTAVYEYLKSGSEGYKQIRGQTGSGVLGAGQPGNYVYPHSTGIGSTVRACFSEWNSHLFTTDDSLECSVTKIVQEQDSPTTSYFSSITAGLPVPYTKADVLGINAAEGIKAVTNDLGMSPVPEAAYTLAEDLRVKIKAHIQDTAPGGSSHKTPAQAWNATYDTALVFSLTGNKTQYLYKLVNYLTSVYKTHTDWVTRTAYHFGYGGGVPADYPNNEILSKYFLVGAARELIDRLNDLRTRFNAHDGQAKDHANASMHQVTAAAFDYSLYDTRLVALHFYQEYTAGDKTFSDFGPVASPYIELFVLKTGVLPEQYINIGQLTSTYLNNNNATPGYKRNLSYRNQGTSLKVRIYATELNGTEFYLWKEAPADYSVFYLTDRLGDYASTTYKWTLTDLELADKEVLYTSGGVVNNDAPPVCKYIQVINNTGYYAHCKNTFIEESETTPNSFTETTYTFTNRLYQSVPGDPDSVPALFYLDFDTNIVGLSTTGNIPIVFTQRGVFRIDGNFDILGAGGMRPTAIHDTVTCAHNASIVKIPEGLVWLSSSGVWYTNGYKAERISEHLPDTIATFAQDANKEQLYGMYEPNQRRVYWTVRTTNTGNPDKILVLDLRMGISGSATFSTMSGQTNSYGGFWPSAMIAYNGKIIRGETNGGVYEHKDSLKSDFIGSAIYNSSVVKKATIYRYKTISTSFGTEILRKYITRAGVNCQNLGYLSVQPKSYNDDEVTPVDMSQIRHRNIVDYKTIHYWLRFPARNLRCSFKAVELTNANTVISNSDTYGQATITGTIATVMGYTPVDINDCYIYFSNDNYTTAHAVTGYSANTIVYANAIPNGTYRWVIKGIAKDEKMYLLNLSIQFALIGKTQVAPQAPTVGMNA